MKNNDKLNNYFNYLKNTSVNIKRFNELAYKDYKKTLEEEKDEFQSLYNSREVINYLDIEELLKNKEYEPADEEFMFSILKAFISNSNSIPYLPATTEERTWLFTKMHKCVVKKEYNELVNSLNIIINSDDELKWMKRYYELYYYVLIEGVMPKKDVNFFNSKLSMINWYNEQCALSLKDNLERDKMLKIYNIRLLSNIFKNTFEVKYNGINVGYELSNTRTILNLSKKGMAKQTGLCYSKVLRSEANKNKKPINVIVKYQKEIDNSLYSLTNTLYKEDLLSSNDVLNDVIADEITRLVFKK